MSVSARRPNPRDYLKIAAEVSIVVLAALQVYDRLLKPKTTTGASLTVA